MENILSAKLLSSVIQDPRIILQGIEERKSAGAISLDIAESEGFGLIFDIFFGVMKKPARAVLTKLLQGKGITRAEGDLLSGELSKVGKKTASNNDIYGNKTKAGQTFNEGKGNLLPNVEKVTVDTRKVTEYALNPKNTSGGANKARVFESALGYNQSNSNQLMQQIQSKLPTSNAILGTADKYGQRFTVDIPITGPNGKTAIVRTGWILEPDSDVPRMTTVFVK